MAPAAPARSALGRATIAAVEPEQPTRGSVLVVDDEPTIVDVVGRYLVRAGYEALGAADGHEALRLARLKRPNLVVLDLMLPGIGGLEVMRRLREEEGSHAAVILLTAKGEATDRVIGLRRGADDYVVKPFSPAELIARVDAVLRRRAEEPARQRVMEFGSLRIEPAGRTVMLDGRELGLTQREFDLLAFLAEHRGQAFSRDQLMDAVWQQPYWSDTTTVTVHVRRVRAKIEDDPARPRYIQTVWGVGYRFRP